MQPTEPACSHASLMVKRKLCNGNPLVKFVDYIITGSVVNSFDEYEELAYAVKPILGSMIILCQVCSVPVTIAAASA